MDNALVLWDTIVKLDGKRYVAVYARYGVTNNICIILVDADDGRRAAACVPSAPCTCVQATADMASPVSDELVFIRKSSIQHDWRRATVTERADERFADALLAAGIIKELADPKSWQRDRVYMLIRRPENFPPRPAGTLALSSDDEEEEDDMETSDKDDESSGSE